MHFFLGESPAARNARPGMNLNLDDSFTDPVTATAASALANVFFGLFGTNETDESPR